MYKDELVEYIDMVWKNVISKALESTENQRQLLFINWIRVWINQVCKAVLDIKTEEKDWYSLITWQKIVKKNKK